MASRKGGAAGLRAPAAFAGALALALLCVCGSAARAESVSVDIGFVVASNSGKSIDPALAAIKQKLQSMFNYSSYRMLDRKKKTLAVGEEGVFDLPANRSVRVTPAAPSGNKVRLSVQVVEGTKNLLTTTLGMNRGGMVLVGGPPYEDGVMILFITAE